VVKKRSSTAETLTAEQRAFLHHGDETVPTPFERTAAPEPLTSKVVNMPPKPTADRQPRKQTVESYPCSPVRRGQALQSISLRLSPNVVRSLRRAACQRAIDYEEPFTQQGMAEAAITKWLQDHGYTVD